MLLVVIEQNPREQGLTSTMLLLAYENIEIRLRKNGA